MKGIQFIVHVVKWSQHAQSLFHLTFLPCAIFILEETVFDGKCTHAVALLTSIEVTFFSFFFCMQYLLSARKSVF